MDEPRSKKRRLAPEMDASARNGDQSSPSQQPHPPSSAPPALQNHTTPTVHLSASSQAQTRTNRQSPFPGQNPEMPLSATDHPVSTGPAATAPADHSTPRNDSNFSSGVGGDFFNFAQSLQNAAMFFKQRGEQSPHSSASALLLQWDGAKGNDARGDDTNDGASRDRDELGRVLNDKLGWSSEKWDMPTTEDEGGCEAKVHDKVRAFFEGAQKDELKVVYYAGHSFVEDDETYWTRDHNSPKVKWDGIRRLFDDSPAEVLLLLDCGPVPKPAQSGCNGMKQMLAGGTLRGSGPAMSFTRALAEALAKLADAGVAFTTKKLLRKIVELVQTDADTNSPSDVSLEHLSPALVTLTPGPFAHLCLGPISRHQPLSSSSDTPANAIDPRAVANVQFDKDRVLVCTTFLGAADTDVSAMTGQLCRTPAIASCVALEAMFFGPPTTLLFSMPQAMYDLVQDSNICLYLGQISSHNLLGLYNQLAAAERSSRLASELVDDNMHRSIGTPTSTAMTTTAPLSSSPPPATAVSCTSLPPTHHVVLDESADMEAAQQLKALRHLRQDDNNHDTARPPRPDHINTLAVAPRRTSLPAMSPSFSRRLAPAVSPTTTATNGHHPGSHLVAPQLAPKATPPAFPHIAQTNTPPGRRPPPRKPLDCTHCGATAFKDAAALRKHTASIHTRPFTCAFAAAGCLSTFGSKNEWKRHMATQHIVSQSYICIECPPRGPADTRVFNRLDLLRSHIRRLHTPADVKHARPESRERIEWENRLRDIAQRCLVNKRLPPQRCGCPGKTCAGSMVFVGPTAWDEWTEHVGKHLEKGDLGDFGVDAFVVQWALQEGILEVGGDGVRLVEGDGGSRDGGRRGSGHAVGSDENRVDDGSVNNVSNDNNDNNDNNDTQQAKPLVTTQNSSNIGGGNPGVEDVSIDGTSPVQRCVVVAVQDGMELD